MGFNSFSADAFASNFVTGFSFVDSIKRSNRQEARLEQRLEEDRADRAFERRRTEERDRQVRENRGFALEDRGFEQDDRDRLAEERTRDRTRDLRGREANKLLADPNSDLGALQAYADFPNVAAEINRRRVLEQDQADAETLFGPQGQTVDGSAPQGFVEALKPPGTGALPTQGKLTDGELNLLANTDPDEAREIRDLQNQPTPRDVTGVITGPSALQIEQERRQAESKDLTTQWDQFSDIANTTGDALRSMNPNLLTAKYFDDRSNITDPNVKRNADTRMRPHITATIEEQTQASITAEPGSREHRNAGRKLREAYGLANEIGFSYSPAAAAGVSGNGLPINRNPQLTANVVESTQSGPGTPLPGNPNQQRMDGTLLHRGTTGRRLNQKQLDAAYRYYKGGRLSLAAYQSFLNTGQLPSGTKTTVEQTDPKQDTWMTITDAAGNVIGRKIIERARDPDKGGRNIVSGDALSNLNLMAAAYNTSDDPQRGTNLLGGFLSALAQNEVNATTAGYDYGNVNDVASLYQRYMDLYVFREAYDDEWFFNGDFNPTFSQDFGDIAQALFSRKAGSAAASGEFEDPRSGEQIRGITPLKSGPQLDYAAVREAFPEQYGNASDQEIQADFDEGR